MKPEIPYKELDSYNEEDADFFFGRDLEKGQILDAVGSHPISIVHGPAGVGKSSILKAGIIKELNSDRRRGNCSIYFDEWEGNVLEKFLSKINTDLSNFLPNTNRNNTNFSSASLVEVLKYWESKLEINSAYLYLFLDQFNDYFRYHQEDSIQDSSSFILQLSDALRSSYDNALRSSMIKVIIALPSPELFKLIPFEAAVRPLQCEKIFIDNLQESSAKEAIIKPIETYNSLVEEYLKIDPDYELADKILADIFPNGKDEWSKGVAPPYLQIIMTSLWHQEMEDKSNSLTLKTFKEKLGGAKGVVKTYLNHKMDLLSETEKEFAEKIFKHLVTPSGEIIPYSPLDLAEYTGIEKAPLKELLLKLAGGDYRILRPVRPSEKYQDEIRYEVFLEILGPAIEEWSREYSEQQRRIQALPLISEDQSRHKQSELGALLARQAYLFREKGYHLKLSQIDEALRESLVGNEFSTILKAHGKAVSSVAISSDGKWLVSGSHDCTVRLWNLEKEKIGQKSELIGKHSSKVLSVAISRDGKWLASAEDDYPSDSAKKNKPIIKLWNLEQRDTGPIVLEGHEKAIRTVTFSPNSQIVASAGDDETIRFWDLEGNSLIDHPLNFGGKVYVVSFSPDGRRLAAGGDARKFGTKKEVSCISIWDLYDSKESPSLSSKPQPIFLKMKRISGRKAVVKSLAFSADGHTLVSGGEDWRIRLWDLQDPHSLPKFLDKHDEHEGIINAVIFLGEKKLASGGEDQRVRLWNREQSELKVKDLKGSYIGISSLALSPGKKIILASGSWDHDIRLWNLDHRSASPKILPKGHEQNVECVTFSPDGKLIASASWDKTVRLWKLDKLAEAPSVIKKHTKRVWSVAFSPSTAERKWLATGGEDEKVYLWDLDNLDTDSPSKTLKDFSKDCISSVAFSPDGKLIAVGTWERDSRIFLWRLSHLDEKPVVLEEHEKKSVTSIVFSPDSQTLASSCDSGFIRLWNLNKIDGKKTEPYKASFSWKGHEERVRSVVFSPDGKLLASSSDDSTIKIWNLEKFSWEGNTEIGDPIPLKGHSFWVGFIAFSPDGNTLASAGYDQTIRLWDIGQLNWEQSELNIEPIILQGHEESVTSVAFSPDGEKLASCSYDNSVRLWIARTHTLAEMVCHNALRDLTEDEWRQFMGSIPYQKTCPF